MGENIVLVLLFSYSCQLYFLKVRLNFTLIDIFFKKGLFIGTEGAFMDFRHCTIFLIVHLLELTLLLRAQKRYTT
jgi:hypothetical protein